jgi:holo-[acyl-carrier protein] synthase
MIVGVGTDLCQVSRIGRALERWGERFEKKVFTPGEIAYCRARKEFATHFAARFAAKEAAYKALGTGISMGVRWKDVEVVRSDGPPRLIFSGKAKEFADRLGADAFHVSLTHDADLAMAVVVLERQGQSGKGAE